MRGFLGFYEREILIGGCVLFFVIFIAGSIVHRYFKDKQGPWTL